MAFGGLDDAANKGKAPMSDINVTPLVDVMLVLLVIFIITAPLMSGALKLDLPSAEGTKKEAPAAQSIRISIDKKQDVYWDDSKLDLVSITQRLEQQAKAHPDTEIQLRADAEVPYGKIVQLMGLAQKAGLSKIGFVAVQPSTP